MKQINAYLTFEGNCRDAMDFYRQCLGGELYLQTVADTPMGAKASAEEKKAVMHAALTKGGLVLMASDRMGGGKGVAGNNMALMLACESEEEIKSLFPRLSAGGKIGHPLEVQFWGAMFGDFTDKFGVRWMLNWDKPKS
jgi:PhnB protein